MNKQKLNKYYEENTTVGFHTGNGVSDGIIDFERVERFSILDHPQIKKVAKEDWYKTYIRVNPNKDKDGYIIDKYSEFKRITEEVFKAVEAPDFCWKRLDLSFNTSDDTYYRNYEKLNRLLIACLALSEKDHNTYDTKNFWTGCTKSLCTKNRHREIEFYDKKDESRGKSPYCARLELRSVNFNGDVETEFIKNWFVRLDRAVEEFENVQKKFNLHMSELFLDDFKKPRKDREIFNINSFLMTRKAYIFTSRQMKDLLMMIGLDKEKAEHKANNFKKYNNIEYFKKSDLIEIVEGIKAKITDYFSK